MHKSSIDIWLTFYAFHTREKYLFDGKQMMHLKQLCKKVKLKCEEKGIETTDHNVLESLKIFLNTVKDPWILSNLDVSLINSKFNVLYVEANNHFKAVTAVADYFKAKHNPQGTRAS